MLGFLLALQFLTLVPIRLKHVDAKNIAASVVWFPFVGLILGLFLTIVSDGLNFFNFPGLSIDITVIILLIYLCGGLHLDGLSDTFDAVCCGKGKEEMLKIMRDSSSGPMGGLAVISVILLKIAFLYAISGWLRPIALILMCVLGRWSMVFTMFVFSYARNEGKAKFYTEGANLKTFIMATSTAFILVVLFYRMSGAIVFLLAAFNAYALGNYFKRKFGGITGDTIGATNEIIETLVLFIISIIGRMGSG